MVRVAKLKNFALARGCALRMPFSGIVTTSSSHAAPSTSPNGNTAPSGGHLRQPDPPPASAHNPSASPGPSPMKQDNHPFNSASAASGMFAAVAAAAASGNAPPPEFSGSAVAGFPTMAAAAGLNHSAITQWLQLQQQEPPLPPPQQPRPASPVKDEPMSPRQGSTHSSGSASGNGSDYATL